MDPRKRKQEHNKATQGRWLINVGSLKELGLKKLSDNYNSTTRMEGLKGAFLGLSKHGYFLQNDEEGEIKNDKRTDS